MEKLTRVRFTNLGKILFPKSGVTKAQVIKHYIRMAPRMLPFLEGRPVVMTRFPDGIEEEGFYGKNAPKGTPDWVEIFPVSSGSSEKVVNYVVCNDLDALLWLANLAALELHLSLSKAQSYDRPDLLLFDLDPKPPAGFSDAVGVAIVIKERLEILDLTGFVKTSGKKGLHILLPIASEYSYGQTREFAHQLGRHLARELEVVVSERSKSQEPGRVYIDYIQNSRGRTVVCPWSLRAEPSATVSTPLGWDELERVGPEDLNIFTIRERSDPWEGFWEERQRLETK